MKKKNLTEIVFILDRSGSMSGLEADTIGGFNAMIEKQKKEDGEALISTVLFDNVSEVIHDRVNIHDIKPMTDRDYTVRGCTAFYGSKFRLHPGFFVTGHQNNSLLYCCNAIRRRMAAIFPNGQFFQHRQNTRLNALTHPVFFRSTVQFFVHRHMPDMLCHLHIVLPDMAQHGFLALGVLGAHPSGGTGLAKIASALYSR